MTIAESLLPEFDEEMSLTRKTLEAIPNDKLDWKPHKKSNTIGWNANHLADIPNWIEFMLDHDSLDIAPVDGPAWKSPSLESIEEILALFDKNVATARAVLAKTPDDVFAQDWAFMMGGQVMFTMTKGATLRKWALSHMIHHRATVRVYLRMNDIPVPGVYGPSGDE
ncbi:DinB family protein [Blastopirellula marina]|uniref:DinB-like domain-containing protein n=1 Tax=Blastopirellula marina DSM 3645 TaxID=314230 RepID=A3ZLS2_9BACT|nr:DinB family protein [Blastopirellula marina]EAQ82705.1 hypothetical protein DSM3645_09907 [Blastopirellula marina DSM 3645]